MVFQGIQDFFQLVEVIMGVIRLGEDTDVIDVYNDIVHPNVFLGHGHPECATDESPT
jgi:hypothetical protein